MYRGVNAKWGIDTSKDPAICVGYQNNIPPVLLSPPVSNTQNSTTSRNFIHGRVDLSPARSKNEKKD